MKPKLIIAGFLLLSFLGFGAGYILTNSIDFGFCVANAVATDASCINFYERLGDPFFYGMGALAVVFFALLFVQRAFSMWWKFGIWFIPLAALLFIFYPEGGAMDLAWPFPEIVFQWVSGLYVVVSAGIIVAATVKK